MTPQEMKALLALPNRSILSERKELVILTVLYDTGARVSELYNLKVRDIRFEAPSIITLTGKGEKTRHVPIMKNTVLLLKQYLSDLRYTDTKTMNTPLFINCHHAPYTRKGISYIIAKYKNELSNLLFIFSPLPEPIFFSTCKKPLVSFLMTY